MELNQKTRLFVLENEKSTTENPDVSPFRCVYCGELAVIERDESSVPVSAYCACEDATTENVLNQEIEEVKRNLYLKENELFNHIETKSFDIDTKHMRFEDELKTLKAKYGIVDEDVNGEEVDGVDP